MYKHPDENGVDCFIPKTVFVSEGWRFNTFGIMNSSKILIFRDQAEDLFVLAYSLLENNICSLGNAFLVFWGDHIHPRKYLWKDDANEYLPTWIASISPKRNAVDIVARHGKLRIFCRAWSSQHRKETSSLRRWTVGKIIKSRFFGGCFCYNVRIEVWQPNSAAKYICDIYMCTMMCIHAFKYMHNTTLYQV